MRKRVLAVTLACFGFSVMATAQPGRVINTGAAVAGSGLLNGKSKKKEKEEVKTAPAPVRAETPKAAPASDPEPTPVAAPAAASQEFNPSEAPSRISYILKDNNKYCEISVEENGSKKPILREITGGTKMDKDYFKNNISSTDYKIYSLDGKKLIATYTTQTHTGILTMTVTEGNRQKTFDITKSLPSFSGIADNMKRTYPVYWLWKNGLVK